MDKFEFKLKAKQLNKLMAAKDYNTALEVLNTMEWNKSKDVGFLLSAAELYELKGMYNEAIDVLLRAYEFSGNGRLITYKLTNLAIKAGNKEEATEYYKEFIAVAPRDMERYALRYQVAKLNGESPEKLIIILEKQRELDLDEEWSYELAELYHKVGRGKECVELCDEIMLYYAFGQYVEKAGALKKLYQPLTPEQEELFENPEKFEENLRRTQEEFQDQEMIRTVNEHMGEEPAAEEPEKNAPQDEFVVVDMDAEPEAVQKEAEETAEEVFFGEFPDDEEEEIVPAVPEMDIDFASLVQLLDVMDEEDDEMYFVEDGTEEPIYEDDPVLYVEEEEWEETAEESAEEVEEFFDAEEEDFFEEEVPAEAAEVTEELPVPDELPDMIPPIAVGTKAEPEEVTLAWNEVEEPAEEAEIRGIFAQEVTAYYEEEEADEWDAEPEATWQEENDRMLEETEQAVLAALEEDMDESYEDSEEWEEAEEEISEEFLVPEEEEDFFEEPEDDEDFFEEPEEDEAFFEEPEEDEDFFEEPEEDEDFFEEPEETEEDLAEAEESDFAEAAEDEDEGFIGEPEDDDEDFFEDPEEEDEEEDEPKDIMPKKTHHILVRTAYANEGMKMAVEALKRLPDEIRPKSIAKTSGEKLNVKGIRGSYEQLKNKILIVQNASALDRSVLGDIREFIKNEENHCIAVLIDSSEGIGEVCLRDPALAALFTTDYEYYEYSADELVAHGVDYAAERGYTFDDMAMLALSAGVEDILSEADGSQWIQTEELVEYAIHNAEKKGLFNRGPKIGKDGRKILKENHLF